MISFLVIFAIAVPLILVAFFAMRRRRTTYEHPSAADSAADARMEHDFEESERMQEQWREEQSHHDHRGTHI